jgi:hypothetical protein
MFVAEEARAPAIGAERLVGCRNGCREAVKEGATVHGAMESGAIRGSAVAHVDRVTG